MWEEKIMVISIYSYFHDVFNSFFSQDHITLYTQSQISITLREKAFENIVGKGENIGNQHFSISHNVFYPLKDSILNRKRNVAQKKYNSPYIYTMSIMCNDKILVQR